MSELPKDVVALFENNPKLKQLLPNPILLSDSVFMASLTRQLDSTFGVRHPDDLYRIVFKKDSARELLTIQSGELSGLFTTTCVEKGRFSDVAGLQRIKESINVSIFPSLLNVAIYRSLKSELSYISQITTDIRNSQIEAEQARFERITEVILDSYQCIPMASFDRGLRDIQLSRVIKSNDDCYELYVLQREDFKKLIAGLPRMFSIYYGDYNYGEYNRSNFIHFDMPSFFEGKVMKHPVFTVFERLAAGRVCEVLLSGNYSSSNIDRHRRLLNKVITELRHCLQDLFRMLDNGSSQLEAAANNGDLSRNECDKKQKELDLHNNGIGHAESLLLTALERKAQSLDLLEQMTAKDKVDLYVINGALLINDDTVEALEDVRQEQLDSESAMPVSGSAD